jgi:hypothetical protein
MRLKPESLPNKAFHLTAARLRFGKNPNGYGWAAAGERPR